MRVAPKITLNAEDRRMLEKWSRSRVEEVRLAERARVVLMAAEGKTNREIGMSLGISEEKAARWRGRFINQGLAGIEKDAPGRGRKPKYRDSECIKNAVFALLHSPPSQHDINRTSWKLADLRQCLSQQQILISETTISRIVKAAGFNWSKATEVLTSNDLDYQEKLARIKSVLSTLGENERFCSIDEYGPFAVKLKGGTRLVGPGEHPHVPQFQKSKGCLIVTAALELSQNQVTHFYSMAKNQGNRVKLRAA